MTELPSGEVTFLFTDVEGSTLLWDQQHELMNEALTNHDQLLLAAIESNHGHVFSTAGDSFGAAFADPSDALATALQVQVGLRASTNELRLRIRIGIHAGEATIRDNNYFGIEVNRAARVMSAAHGGQVLLSQRAVDLLGDDADCVDLGDFLLKDLRRPERLFQFNHPDLESQFPQLRSLDQASIDIRAPLTRFIGREQELIEVNRLLAESRLVTLTGTGGAGKTRLALKIATDAHYQFPDGLKIVELAAVTEEDVLIEEVAQVFQVKVAADTPIVESLTAAIGAQRGLLILDNCEQLVGAVKRVVTKILSDCPNMKVLCTSRELLHVTGEVVYRVPSLSIPTSDVDLTAAGEYDAINMFMDRAQLSNPEFELSAVTFSDVIAICTHLDGIPLALELAAARMRLMSPAQIAGRLDERFLSVAAESSAGSRHQTLQNAIDWSYNLLDEPEKVLFQRLGGFIGDFTLDAIEQVCADAPLEDVDLSRVLFGLVDKSMITPEHGTNGTTRYRLLESMRNYGRQKLNDAGDLDQLQRRHLQYYTRYCESLQGLQRSGNLGEALAALDDNEDNIRAALRYGLHETYYLLVARMIGAVGYLWYAGGLYREGSDWCSELFDAEPDLPDDVWAAVLHAYGTLLGSWAQPRDGAEMLEQEVELRRRLADPARLAAALNNLGNLQHDLGRFDEAEATLREAIDQFRLAGESPTLALSSLGAGYLHAGELEQAIALYSEALEEAVAVEDPYATALATHYVGHCAALQGDLTHGRQLLDEARERFETLTVKPGVASADYHLALIDRAEGDLGSAAQRLLTALSTPDAHWYLATQYWILQAVASIIPDSDLAIALLGVAKAHYDRSSELQPSYVLEDLATVTEQLQASVSSADFSHGESRGRRLPPPEAIARAVSALKVFVAGSADTYV